ncbi:MAG: hypothetical protein DRR08_16620 [Candidatus Parabeggiatoa sp. nov. 2]|nr:MAG: hypothetical protein B6247_17175 [Beggiatoa sp. 4572_84]RKZ58368.1 MAG: hypothetical protein DRR08_16620 [Gammaproteobacteria bacterium]
MPRILESYQTITKQASGSVCLAKPTIYLNNEKVGFVPLRWVKLANGPQKTLFYFSFLKEGQVLKLISLSLANGPQKTIFRNSAK